MARTVVAVTFLLLLLGVGGAWFTVSTDRWPWDDRAQPAKAVWALNDSLGRFLYEHGQDTPEEVAAARPRREGLTAVEQAEVKKALESDGRLRDRITLHGGGASGAGAPRRG